MNSFCRLALRYQDPAGIGESAASTGKVSGDAGRVQRDEAPAG
jgi:hypothetical protein